MPRQSCTKDGKPGYKWGESGHCYTYEPGDEESRKAAKAKADRQGRAIKAGDIMDLPATVRQMEAQAQQIWAAVYQQAEKAERPDPAAVAYRALEEYLLTREMDAEKSIRLDVIRPGTFSASSGKVKWTEARQRKLLESMTKAAENGVLPTIRFGDHDNKTVVGWALEVYETEADDEGPRWISVRPFITDPVVRERIFNGEIRYVSAEIRPEFTVQGNTYKEFLQTVVLLDPERLPGNYPAVPRSRVIVATSESDDGQKALLFEGGAVTGGDEMSGENTEFKVDEVLNAISGVSEAVQGLSESMGGVQETLEGLSTRVGDIDTRLTALEEAGPQGAEPEGGEPEPGGGEEEKVKEEVNAELTSLAANEDGYVACLSASNRESLGAELSALDATGRKAALAVLKHLPRTSMGEQTFTAPGNASSNHDKEETGAERFSAAKCPEDPTEKAQLRGDSVRMLRAEVDADKLPEGMTIQEKAVQLSQAKHPHLWE
jgi:hypothetical protein